MATSEQTVIKNLIRRIKRGERQARKELFSLLSDHENFANVIHIMAHALLSKAQWARRFVDTQDIVQSALRSGLRNIEDFRGNTEGELYGWLRAILRTKVNRVVRRRQLERNKKVLGELGRTQEERLKREELLPVATVVDRELIEVLHAAIAELPLDLRLVVELRLRGMDTTEITSILDLQPATVRKRESRATQRLRELIE